MWQRHLANAFHQGKRTIGNMFNSAVKGAGQLDHGIAAGKRLPGMKRKKGNTKKRARGAEPIERQGHRWFRVELYSEDG